ncbi:hypothetical protein EDC04DRAFT_2912082 [Pisolithus marmoratus]|nr:hypothetical protein EDC04DRAFT_2912082 [Pisolithus marmoratus]
MLRDTAPALEKLCFDMPGPSGSPSKWAIEPGIPDCSVNANHSILLPVIQLALACSLPFEPLPAAELCLPSLKALALDFGDEDCIDLVTYLVGPATTATATATSGILNNC